MKHKLLMLGLLLATLSAQPAWSRITPPNAAVKVNPEQATRNAIGTAYEHYQGGNYESALKGFTTAIESTGFERLPDETRHAVLVLAGSVALQGSQWATAQRYYKRATGFAEAEVDDWHKRLRAAWALHDLPDSALSVSTIAQRWPETLADVNARAIYSMVRQLRDDPKLASIHLGLLQRLFDANWADDGQQPNQLWLDLTRLLLQQSKVSAAREVAMRIDSATTLLTMQVDRRFDPITRGGVFDLDRSVRNGLARAASRVGEEPKKLQRVVDLQYLQLSALQFKEVLAADDAIIASVGAGDSSDAYSDFSDAYVWILDNRARALRGLGRWDEALQQQRRAARRPEHGQLNVSQALNLGIRYALSGHPDEAIDAIIDLGNTSPYGEMVRASVLALAAMQHEDEAELAKQVRFMSEHRKDSVGAYQDVLLQIGDMDAAEALLIERLRNDAWRSDALIEMQHYAVVPRATLEKRLDERRNELVARPAVAAEIAKVGRVMTVNLAPPFT